MGSRETRDVNDRVAAFVVYTLYTDLNSMLNGTTRLSPKVDEFLEQKKFQISSNPERPLGVWYNGMLEACDNPDKVIAVLDSGSTR